MTTLPKLVWPEAPDAELEDRIVSTVRHYFAEKFICDSQDSSAIYLFVTDPPKDTSSIIAWLQSESVQGHLADDSKFDSIKWGTRGQAVVVYSKWLFEHCLEAVFRTKSNDLAIIAACKLVPAKELTECLPIFIQRIMNNKPMHTPELRSYYGMIFDWGELIEIFEGNGNSAYDEV